MGDANPIRTLGDYSKPSHKGYRNTIELPVGSNVREEINDRMAEMFGLLKELTTSKVPEKVKERNDDNDVAAGDDIKKPTETKMGMPVKEAENENEAKNGIKNEPIKKARKEETTEAPNSQLVEYYLKLKMFD
ncbi:hypothetical protein Tco_0743818 [Tanacetum coccineum]